MIKKNYSSLCLLPTFEDRFDYLKLQARIGDRTFGSDRYLNQLLYRDPDWRSLRERIIIRDNGCDLGVDGYPIAKFIVVHHIVPITIEDVKRCRSNIFDPENLICTSSSTHRAIHYENAELLPRKPIERKPGDTCPWM